MTAGHGWNRAAWLIAAVLALLLGLYSSAAASLVETWTRSETFAHGYVIFPISLWLVWAKRHEVAALRPAPNYRVLPLLLALGFVWVLGNLGRVQVVQQYALVLMLPAAVWATLGNAVARSLAFPLAYLLFAVPFGEALIPYLIEFTADFTVFALKLSGIPVYREGAYFSVPSGNWSVVEACSGLRYLIASFSLGCLYAYLTYRSLKRRALFVAASLLVPVVANWLRAYLIVMIGHLSDMRLAVGVDHYIYGWVFFGLVMLLLFWVGTFWREDLEDVTADKKNAPVADVPLNGLTKAGVSVLVAAGLWPAYAAYLEHGAPPPAAPTLIAPDGGQGWQKDSLPLSAWQPRYLAPRARIAQTYHKDGQRVALYLYAYRQQEQGSELINSRNVLVWTEDKVWEKVGERLRGSPLEVVESQLRAPRQRLLVWHWYRVDGHGTANAYRAKLLESWAKFAGRQDDGALIAIAAPYEEHPEDAEKILAAFARDMLPRIEASLARAHGS